MLLVSFFFFGPRPLWESEGSYDSLFWKALLCKYIQNFPHLNKVHELKFSCFGEKSAISLHVGNKEATFMKQQKRITF